VLFGKSNCRLKTGWTAIALLSQQKRLKIEDGGDSLTASLICPEKKEDTEKIQKSFLHAFNNAM